MVNLFGVNIAQIIADAIRDAGGVLAGTLTRTPPGTRNVDDPTQVTPATPVSHSFQGFIEQRSIKREDSLIVETVSVLSIIGASISPATTPKVNDTVSINGQTMSLIRLINADPAEAVYEFEVN